jgi:RimJ/RimL family protein N-acetyltransferase
MTTAKVRLRLVAEGDLALFFEHQRDPQANAMAAFPSREQDAFMEHWAKVMKDPRNTLRTIVFEDRVAGNIVSWDSRGERDIGYWLGREFWGKGIATEALRTFLHVDSARPLYAHVAVHNIGSRRVLEKCAFQIVGEQIVPASEPGGPVNEYVLRLD